MWLFPLVALPLVALFFLWALGVFDGIDDWFPEADEVWQWAKAHWPVYVVAFVGGLALAYIIWN